MMIIIMSIMAMPVMMMMVIDIVLIVILSKCRPAGGSNLRRHKKFGQGGKLGKTKNRFETVESTLLVVESSRVLVDE